jgi:hypothetical protein
MGKIHQVSKKRTCVQCAVDYMRIFSQKFGMPLNVVETKKKEKQFESVIKSLGFAWRAVIILILLEEPT